jgi:hypothetical protein
MNIQELAHDVIALVSTAKLRKQLHHQIEFPALRSATRAAVRRRKNFIYAELLRRRRSLR